MTGLSEGMASLVWSIGLISFLNRREELAVPSWPQESIRTGIASAFAVVIPRMLPIKQLAPTFLPWVPIAITPLAVLTPSPAPNPKAVLSLPVLNRRAATPMAVLFKPVVLRLRGCTPLAVL